MWITIIIVLLSAFFIFVSSIKIFGWQKKIFDVQLGMFHKYGLNREIMRVTGLIEAFGAIAIWFTGTIIGTLGALALFGTSLGAISFHLVFDTWKDAVPAMVTLILSGIVAWSLREPVLVLAKNYGLM
jgi:hypothetical protein